MYQLDWGSKPDYADINHALPHKSQVRIDSIESVYLLHWMEHCVECAIPECYNRCPLYVKRIDQRCARFRYGIFPHSGYQGLFNFGADIAFQRWGKLEADLAYGAISLTRVRHLAQWDRRLLSGLKPISALLAPFDHKRKLIRGYGRIRHKILQYLTRQDSKPPVRYDDFIIEAWNPHPEPFKLTIEYVNDNLVKFRAFLVMSPGPNLHKIPCNAMGIDFSLRSGWILIYPENDAEVRIIITWLDFVKYVTPPDATTAQKLKPADKVKCVAWDLDNTLWQGILVEDGPESIKPVLEALDLIKKLDDRGIIQTLVSKNDFDPAWTVISSLGLEDYFIYPAINWGPKSQNLRQIATELNINIDTFALIDDSPFERGEVAHELPQVRTFSGKDLHSLLKLPEFDIPITEASRNRRLSYLAESKRRRILQVFQGNYEQFLESCQIEMGIFQPIQEQHIRRCLELLQRTNQLNLSTHRYNEPEFRALLQNNETLCLALTCQDRFSEYGLVGFLSIDFSIATPILNDLVISCRIANKRIEHAFFACILGLLKERGFERLEARFIPSERNGIILTTLKEVGFKEIATKGPAQILAIRSNDEIPGKNIVKIRSAEIILPQKSLLHVPKIALEDTNHETDH